MADGDVTTVDIFSGCGGFSLGAALAGFRSIAAIDIDPTLQSAYKLNFPNSNPKLADVAKLDAAAWKSILGKSRPDGLIGGPPCQGFSRMGKRAKGDPRNSLIGHFYRHVKILKPKFFIMENVEGLLDDGNDDFLRTAIDTVSDHYEIVGPFIVNASNYGAATSRRRVIVVGYDPNEVAALTENDLRLTSVKMATVEDAIGDLPSPVGMSKGADDLGWMSYPERDGRTLSAYARRMRAFPPKNLGWHIALSELAARRLSGLFETCHTPAVIKRFAKVAQGKSDSVSKCPRLSWEGLCPTLRAGTGSDKGSFQSIRPLHPDEDRVITVREAARLQGFPDWFVFHPTKWHSFRMIGNSVSPFVSEALLSKIRTGMTGALAA